MEKINKIEKTWILISLVLYFIAILLFTYFSNTVSFHDAYEYITLTKEFAGISNINVYTTHSLVYPFLSAQILKLIPNFFTIKILSSIWIFLSGLLIYLYSKNTKALFLWIFSPLSWFMSIQFIPILPASFFILLGYILFKKYEQNNSKFYFILSAISTGLSIIIYFPSIAVTLFFITSFMYNKKFYIPILYIILILLSFIPELILNYVFFGFPFYSFVRYFGINALVILGKSFKVDLIYSYWLLIPIVISPFLYKIIRLDFKKYKRELIFLSLCFIFFGLRGGSINYFLLFSPITILLISQKINKKHIFYNSLISLIIIILLTYNYFGTTFDERIEKDLKKIKQDFPETQFLTGQNRANALATYSWSKEPKFIWLWEYNNQKDYIASQYTIKSNPKINSDKILLLNARLEKANNINFNAEIYFISIKGEEIPNEFKLVKEYDVLSVYKKI